MAVLVFLVVAALFGASRAIDAPFATQMWTLLAAGLFGMVLLVGYLGRQISGEAAAQPASKYENGVIKAGVVASMFWGVAGLLVGLIIALQLAFPSIFYFPDAGWLNFGRLRPLHTSAVIFALGYRCPLRRCASSRIQAP